MANTKASNKSASPNKKNKMGSPMKKQSSQSQSYKSPNKSKGNANREMGSAAKRPKFQQMVTEALTAVSLSRHAHADRL